MNSSIELQYNNRARITETPEILRRWSEDSASYRTNAHRERRAELNLNYSSGSRKIIDAFWPEQDRSDHLAVFIHGGYWQLFEPALFSHIARGPNERGIPFALMGYDLCPAVGLADIIAQTKAACLFLWQRYNRRLVLMGHSAGGHLTAAMLATDWAAEGVEDPHFIAAGLSISGVFDLSPLLQTSMNDKLLLNESSARALSPIYWQPRQAAKIDAWVGGGESEEFQRQSREFVQVWKKRGAEACFETEPGVNHFTIINALTDPRSRIVDRVATLVHAN